MQLKGKIAVVTGASSGIGRETALELARQGACLAVASRRAAVLELLAAEIRQMGVEALAVPVDVSVPEQVEDFGRQVLARFSRVDILIACAGEYVRAPVANPNMALLERAINVNYYGSVRTVQAFLPAMLAQKSGHIFLVSSMDGRSSLPGDGPYAASKAALTVYGGALRQDLHGSGVYVTVVSPGRVATPMIEHMKLPAVSGIIPPQSVARAMVRAAGRPRPEIILPPAAFFLAFFNLISPTFTDFAVRAMHLSGRDS
ncbi:MAG TPA: SDR family NAD(P)-dependent oxidoreductase [Anaerolineaceae bacterium]